MVTMAAMPLTTKVIASVPMSGLMRNRVTMTPLTMPDRQADGQARQDPGRRGHRRRGLQRDGPGQPVDGPDRQVDPAGDQDERPGAGRDDDPGLLVEDVGEVGDLEERRAR